MTECQHFTIGTKVKIAHRPPLLIVSHSDDGRHLILETGERVRNPAHRPGR